MADDDTLPLQSVLRITPLTNVDALGAVEHVAEWFRVKADPELTGLTDLLLRLSLLVEEVPEITEVTLPCVEIDGARYHFDEIAIHVAEEE